MDINVSGEARHTLAVSANGDRFTVIFDGKELIVATNRRFPGPPGKIGLWIQADSTPLFESLAVSIIH
ncbi:hypothetical protein IVB38_28435 [Bradyrhizobium sp. 38]|uniref:hypothetical protein n=1 Tax=unclassified Bradyrhizobium TaxID=2631580 RepID=UPI001FF92C71|nr:MULTISPECIES: hypothetical protein [unclassified Bradyrhizobium]MCK1339822.1 hypothetical protein [Bradyrhizobium sp. 38]MCK1782753.1 hypothetical protein [Bradyrhizobium sp. 132]